METEINQVRNLLLSEKTIENALDISIRKDPGKVADIISPIIMPSIRKSVIDYFERMMFAFNKAIENAFSYQGILWRLEAIKSGRPFSEVVLLHSILFRVEDIFIIHKKTGILLIHCSSIKDRKQSGDQVAAMLSAIHDFVGDAFAKSNKEQGLSSVRVGETNLLMEQSSDLLLAAAIRGEAPSTFKNKLISKLEDFQKNHKSSLENFDGHVDVFSDGNLSFEECLLQELKVPSVEMSVKKKKRQKIISYSLLSLLVFVVVLGGLTLINNFKENRSLNNYIKQLEGKEGLVFLRTEEVDDHKWILHILRTNQFNVDIPRIPSLIKNKVKVISKPFAMYYPEKNPLDEVRIPYHKTTKELNGDLKDVLPLFGRIANSLPKKQFHIHAYVFDEPESMKLKILLSNIIGQLENVLEHGGWNNPKIIHYSILKKSQAFTAPVVRFEVIYD